MKSVLIILFNLAIVSARGQGKADKELTQFFKKHKLDTFLLVKIGCRSCEISYEDSLKTADTMTIFLLSKKHGQLNLITFSDTGKTQQVDNIKSDIFKFITTKRHVLQQADTYYKEQKLANFQAPCLVAFPYEKIQIKIGNFRHKHTLVAREMDDCGATLTNEDWFKIELEILAVFDNLKQAN